MSLGRRIIPAMELTLTKIDWGGDLRHLRLPKEWLAGANIAFRRQVFDGHTFSSHLGRTGGSLLSGEEIEVCLRVQSEGGKISYNPKALVYHTVPSSRFTIGFFRRRAWMGGKSDAIVDTSIYGQRFLLSQTLKYFHRGPTNIIRYLLKHLLSSSPRQ